MLQYTERFFQLCENNNFSEQMCKLMSTVNSENLSFKYYTEHSIQSSILNHKPNAFKVFHLNIRSIELHKVELAFYLEIIKSQFQVILLTETGNANTASIEACFTDYHFFLDPLPEIKVEQLYIGTFSAQWSEKKTILSIFALYLIINGLIFGILKFLFQLNVFIGYI